MRIRAGIALCIALTALAASTATAEAATSCAVSTASSSYAQAVAGTSGIVGYWRLGDSGSVTCDSLGLNSGSYQGGVTLGVAGAIAGDSNTAASFDGSTGNVSVPAASSLNVGDSFTVEAWVKRGSIGGSENQTIASKQNSAWVLMFNPSNQLVLRRSNVADIAASTTTLTDTSSWHHVAVTKSGSAVHLYIDGKDVTGSVSNQTLPDNTMPLAIGQSSTTAYFNGGIDEVALYKGALTASQIQSHYSLGAPASTTPPPTQPPPTSTDPTIAAAGDIACDPTDPDFNNGAGTSIDCQQMAVSNALQANLAAVLPLGDDQYDAGTLSAFNNSFNPSWGRFKSIMHPVPGNHDYQTSGAKGYFDYFDGVGSSTGIAGNRSQGYYSFDVGAWHIIALNSNCSSVGGCSSGSAQEKWLRSDLAAHTNKCTLAYWHHARWTSGGEAGGNSTFMSPMVTDLYNANADVILSGHDHDYERFAPQNPSSAVDTTRGIREFVVGTGGESHHDWGTIQPNSQIRNNTAFGVLNLTLHSTSYSWQFISAAGSSFSDSGSASCH